MSEKKETPLSSAATWIKADSVVIERNCIKLKKERNIVPKNWIRYHKYNSDLYLYSTVCDITSKKCLLSLYSLYSLSAVAATTPMTGWRARTLHQSRQTAEWCLTAAARPSPLSVARETIPLTSTRWRSVGYMGLGNKMAKWQAPYWVWSLAYFSVA